MRLRQLLIYLFCLAAGALFATAAAAERRVALVIGNSSYKNATSLPNTINDANALATTFKSVGFEVVISRTDLGVVDFKRSVREFLITAENADIAVVYYAGHGIEIGGTNYLVPVDARLSRDYDVDDEAVSLDRIVWALQSVRRLRLILLDACRDNPFAAKLRSAGMRAPSRGGLAKIEEVSADTLVAYAAKAGSVSYDGDGVNSPYATALIRHLGEPGLDIRIALGRVRDDVVAMTGGRQEPFIYGSLGGSTIALVAPGAVAKKVEPAAAPAPAAPAPAAVVRRESPAVAVPAPSPPPSALPKPSVVVTAPPPVPPAIKIEPPKPPLPAQAALETVEPCVRDEQRPTRSPACSASLAARGCARRCNACSRATSPNRARRRRSQRLPPRPLRSMLRRNRRRKHRRRLRLPKILACATWRGSPNCAPSRTPMPSPGSSANSAANGSARSSSGCAKASVSEAAGPRSDRTVPRPLPACERAVLPPTTNSLG
jgi:hypothetical protein